MIWVYLLSEGLVAREDSHRIPTYLAVIGFALLSIYLSYFAVVSFTVLKVAKQMKKAYKYLVFMTIAVITVSVVLVQLNGQMHEYE
jgi:FtsH-binding integral membrane protein